MIPISVCIPINRSLASEISLATDLIYLILDSTADPHAYRPIRLSVSRGYGKIYRTMPEADPGGSKRRDESGEGVGTRAR